MDVVRIVDKVGLNSLIENERFENALIVGPAVLAPLEHATIENCTFDGTPESIFIEVPEGRRVLGVIGLRNTSFRRCEFRNVAIMGTPKAIREFRKGFSGPAPTPA